MRKIKNLKRMERIWKIATRFSAAPHRPAGHFSP